MIKPRAVTLSILPKPMSNKRTANRLPTSWKTCSRHQKTTTHLFLPLHEHTSQALVFRSMVSLVMNERTPSSSVHSYGQPRSSPITAARHPHGLKRQCVLPPLILPWGNLTRLYCQDYPSIRRLLSTAEARRGRSHLGALRTSNSSWCINRPCGTI